MELPSKNTVDELFKQVEDVLKYSFLFTPVLLSLCAREPDSSWKVIGTEGTFRVVRKVFLSPFSIPTSYINTLIVM